MQCTIKGCLWISSLGFLLLSGCGRVQPTASGDLASIRIHPQLGELYLNQIVQLSVEATYVERDAEGWQQHTRDITHELGLSWRQSSGMVVELLDGARLLGRQAGDTRLQVFYDGRQDTLDLSVRYATLEGLTLSPADLQLDLGEYRQLTVSGQLSDDSLINLSLPATGTRYVSSDRTVAVVSAEGIVFGLAEGICTIQVENEDFAASGSVQVGQPARLTTLELSPAQLELEVGSNSQLHLIGSYDDGTSKDLTQNPKTSFASLSPTVATVSATGQVQALATGTATITAIHQDYGDWTTVTVVTGNMPIAIEISPANLELTPGQWQALSVAAQYDDGTQEDVTFEAQYQSSNPELVQVAADGRVLGQRPGTATIVAEYLGWTDSCAVTVHEARTLQGISITPATAQINKGENLQLTVTGNYSDGSQSDLTAATTGTYYRSFAPELATISLDGLVTALSAGGPVRIMASHQIFNVDAEIMVQEFHAQPVAETCLPQQVPAGASNFYFKIYGQGFDQSSVILWDGNALDTTLRGINTLETIVPDSALTSFGSHSIAVFNPTPGGGISNSLTLLGVEPPVLQTVAPDSGLQGQDIRVVISGSGLLGCLVQAENHRIKVSDIYFAPDGSFLAATFTIYDDAPPGPTLFYLTNAAGRIPFNFTVIEDQVWPDLIIEGPGTVSLEGVQTYHNILIKTGAVVIGDGSEALQLLATGQVTIYGEIHVSGKSGADGYFDPAPGGAAGPGGGGGGGGGDGDSLLGASGGPGTPAGEDAAVGSGAGTGSGAGGGTGGGAGIEGGCGQAGGGGGFGGHGGGGGGDAGPGTGGPGGTANEHGSDCHGGVGGGGGSTCGTDSGGGGGGGGGVLVIATVAGGDIIIKGALHANGGRGGAGHLVTGGGGGGSGGRITLTATGGHILVEDVLSVRGGAGGNSYRNDGGGGGGGGRIFINAGGGSVDDSNAWYDLEGGPGGLSLDPIPPELGNNGNAGTDGPIDIQQ